MTTELIPQTSSQLPSRRRAIPLSGFVRAWWKRGLIALSVVAFLATAVVLITKALASEETGPRMTHIIARSDLVVTVVEQGLLESSENTEIKCQVRGRNTVIWVINSGAIVEPGDVLVRLDTLFMEEQINERTKYAHWSRSGAERSIADVARAEIAVKAYEKGTYVTEMMNLQKDLTIAESRLKSAEHILRHAKLMAESKYVSDLEVEEKEFAVDQAKLQVQLMKTRIDVLERFTRAERLQTLQGELTAIKANHEANAERATADASRRDRALEEYKHCVVRAERGGLVIHPSAARWENAPEIEQGTSVHKDQVMLLMPDLSKMQVKVGVHEAVVDRVKEGLSATIMLPDKTLQGKVTSVASVTRPAGWWTGNEVRYDTLIELPNIRGLRPGMSAEVEILIAKYEDVLTIPIAAIVEGEEGSYCWVKTRLGTRRREIVLGDSNDVYTIVKEGLKEGDEVILDPRGASRKNPDEKATSTDKKKPGHKSADKAASKPADNPAAKPARSKPAQSKPSKPKPSKPQPKPQAP